MDNTLYVALSRQMVLSRQMDIVANNIANTDTTAFKVEDLMQQTDAQAPALTAEAPVPVKFVTAAGVARNFTQGAFSRTGSTLDVAIDGQGFFRVSTSGGERYTRDGHFRMDDAGRIVTQGGDPVLDDGGSEITIDPTLGPVAIGEDGSITQGGRQVGTLGVVAFGNRSTLEKTGDNLYQNTSNQQPQTDETSRLRQGMLESSNVQPMREITQLIEVSRAYEQIAHMMDATADLSKTAVERLGKTQ